MCVPDHMATPLLTVETIYTSKLMYSLTKTWDGILQLILNMSGFINSHPHELHFGVFGVIVVFHKRCTFVPSRLLGANCAIPRNSSNCCNHKILMS